PADTRFLNVLQGADPGAPMAPATYVQSTSGTAFDGAAFAGSAVYFPVTNVGFAGTTLSAPSGVGLMLVTGLTPNATYSISVQSAASGNVVSIAPASSGTAADSAGVLRLTF
ncbi:MAG TPA: hypothetical protein VMB26_12155, partial [Candidatus Binataceae bacterium]|nr:hypothetical protein [Candidatus Binataceae bacterium]